MGFVLTVYFQESTKGKESIKEIFLPGVNNRIVYEILEKEISGIDFDITLMLEVFENKWNVRTNDHLIFEADNISLSDGLKLDAIVKSPENHSAIARVVIFVGAYYPGMTEFEKYNFGEMKINIGSKVSEVSKDSNRICYSYKPNAPDGDKKDYIEEEHAYLERNKTGAMLVDCGSKNGAYLNGKRIKDREALKYGDIIFILGLKIVYLGDLIAVNKPKSNKLYEITFEIQSLTSAQEQNSDIEPDAAPADEYYQRSPRKILQLDEEAVEIEAPPQFSPRRKTPLWMTIGPSFSMILPMIAGALFTMYGANSSGMTTGPFMFMGIITSGTAAVIGVFWSLNNYRYQNKIEKEDERNRETRYKKYLDDIEETLKGNPEEGKKGKLEQNRETLKAIYPGINEIMEWVFKQDARVWEKNINHPDFLELRLGIGSCLSPNRIIVPKSKFSLIDDELAKRPFKIQEDYQNLKDVPVSLSFYEHNLIGVIGDRTGIAEIARIIAMQVAVLHSYTDVKLVFIYNDRENWDFVKWLPHTWASNGSLRMVANDSVGTGEICYYLSGIIRDRMSGQRFAGQDGLQKKSNYPHYVVFITDPAAVENETVMKYLISPEANIGFTSVLLYDRIDRLPNDCTVIIQKDEKYSGYYSLNNAFGAVENVEFDRLPETQMNEISRELSKFRVKEAEGSGAIPQMLTFLDMYKTNAPDTINIYRNWLENHTYESMKALIGHRGSGAPLYLDIHEKYHGPHGLVAGTTGSGKSEMLQTYILSLALTYHPHEISFILIDYKGGGMAESFRGMPHIAGIITNLGGNQTNRALASIESEKNRRQAMFNKYGVKHIDNYIELYTNAKKDESILESGPIPHLIIIADEFAELKKERPEFIAALVSAARVGRSLGVHLILATQKPDGLIDPQIESNTRFRICLRVADRQDSISMLKKPEAAYITNPGRGYFQVGNDEIFEEFQSGWSGAKYEPDAAFSDDRTNVAKMINLWGKLLVVRTGKKEEKKEPSDGCKFILNIKKTYEIINNASESVTISAKDQNKYDFVYYNASGAETEKCKDRRGDITVGGKEKVIVTVNPNNPVEFCARPEDADKIATTDKTAVQIDALVKHMIRLTEDSGIAPIDSIWLPPLPDIIYLKGLYELKEKELKEYEKQTEEWVLDPVVGLIDDPVNQEQRALRLNFIQDGHMILCGSNSSGKTTFLQTLIYSLITTKKPSKVNIYIADYGSRMLGAFRNSPHVGDIVFDDEEDKTNKLMAMLTKELGRRKIEFSQKGAGTFKDYVMLNKNQGENKCPAILFIIDNYSAFMGENNYRRDDNILLLVKEAASYGIYLIMSCGTTSDVRGKIRQQISFGIGLQLSDKFEYADIIGVRPEISAEENCPGRGLIKNAKITAENKNPQPAPLEFQTAVCLESDSLNQEIEKISSELNKKFPGVKAPQIPQVPENMNYDIFAENPEVIEARERNTAPIGYDMEEARLISVDFTRVFAYIISGAARTGKTNMFKVILSECVKLNYEVYFIDTADKKMKSAAKEFPVTRHIAGQDEIYDFLGDILIPEFKRRNALIEKKGGRKFAAEAMAEEKNITIFIHDFGEFLQTVYNDQRICPFVELMMKQGGDHKISVIARITKEDASMHGTKGIYVSFTNWKEGIYLGGMPDQQRIFDFEMNLDRKKLKPGQGHAILKGETVKIITPII